MKVRKAVIPAAGLGTRFLPATKAMPKEMLPIVDTPTIQYIIQEAIDSGIEEILIITGMFFASINSPLLQIFFLSKGRGRVWHHLTRQLSFRGGTLNGSSYRALREPLS